MSQSRENSASKITKITHFLLPILFVTAIASVALNYVFFSQNQVNQKKYLTYTSSNEYVNELFKEHIFLLADAVQSLGTNESVASTQALENNTTLISQWLGQRYGESFQYQFQTLWRAQIQAQLSYAQAVKAKAQDEKVKQVVILSAAPAELAKLIQQINPTVDQGGLKLTLETYYSWTKTLVDSYLAGDFVSFYKIRHESLVLMNSLAQTMVR